MIDSKSNRVCPSCFSENKKAVGEKNGYNIFFCRDCKTLYSTDNDKIPVPFDYADYYTGRDISTPEFVAHRLNSIVATFEPFKQNNCLLDVGCGSGAILEAAKQNNWAAEGVEVSSSAIEHLRSQGFKAFHGYLQDAKYAENSFDVVTAVELFEHLSNPLEVISEIARILRPGGLLWATTPHAKGISGRLLKTEWSTIAPPEHIQIFSIKGLKKLLYKSGFSKVEIHTHGINPYEILRALKKRESKNASDDGGQEESDFNRNKTSFQLNSYLSESTSRRLIKNVANGILDLTRLGDSLKIRAQK